MSPQKKTKEEYVTVAKYAELAQMTRQGVMKRIKNGVISGAKKFPGGTNGRGMWMIPIEEFVRIRKKQNSGKRPPRNQSCARA